MLASVMASCLYCVPYHSSVLSVCPSNDFDTTATLEKEKSEPGQATWTQKTSLSELIRYSSFVTTPQDQMRVLSISIAFGSRWRQWRSINTSTSN